MHDEGSLGVEESLVTYRSVVRAYNENKEKKTTKKTTK